MTLLEFGIEEGKEGKILFYFLGGPQTTPFFLFENTG